MTKNFMRGARLISLAMPLLLGAWGSALGQTPPSGVGSTFPAQLHQDLMPGNWTYGPAVGASENIYFLTDSGANFAAGESALTSSDLMTYTNAAIWGPVIQVPAAAAAVLLPYKESGVTTLNLATAELCRIFSFSPAARNWNQITTAADDGAVGPASAIQVVYRNEVVGSGTTYLLSRFLNAACGSYLPPNKFFTVSSVFQTMVATALPTLTATQDANGDGLPDAWVGVQGDAGMSLASNQLHRLGYISPDPAYTSATNDHVARVNGLMPTATGIQAMLPAPPSGANRLNPLNWVPAYVVPVGAYPIWGTTNLLFAQCYQGGFGTPAMGAALKSFLTGFSSGGFDLAITARNFVPLPLAWKTAIADAFLTGSDGNGLAFGNAADCSGIPGRP
jgi:phosphate transport system substrate-binding protein